jgi:hypothetical protein
MGMFDDLIPKPTPDKPQGLFDDLVAEAKTKQKASKITFDDLIPKKHEPVQVAPKPSAPKEYWDAAKGIYTDITGDIKKGFGDKNPWELFKTESLPANIVTGVKRDPGMTLDIDPSSGSLTATDTSKPKSASDKTDPGILEDLKALGVTTREHPGLVIGSLVKSVVADPELLLPWLWEAIPEATAAKVAQAAKAMGASVDLAKAAEVGGRVAGRAAVGGTVGAAVEGGSQVASGDVDVGKIGRAAAEGAVLSIPGRMGRKKVAAPRGEIPTPHEEAVAAGVAEPLQGDLFNASEAETAAKIPDERLTPMETSREALAQATAEDPITPQMIADIQNEPIRPPNEAKDRLVKAVKQAIVGGAVGAGAGYVFGKEGEKTAAVETGIAIGAGLPLLKARKYLGPDISELVNARNSQVRVVARHIYQFQNQIEKLLPLKADREKLAEMIDHGVTPEVGTPMHEAYMALKAYFAQMGQLAKDAGVVEALRDNYISHIVEEAPKPGNVLQRTWRAVFGGNEGGAPPGGKQFGKERKYDTFEDLQAALKDSGLQLKTKDVSEIAATYGNAVYKSIADRHLIDVLKNTPMPDGRELIMPIDKAPRDYVPMDTSVLAGVRVHPDVAADLKFIFSSHNPNWLVRKLGQLTSITKRVAVAVSLFHAKTLMDGMLPGSVGLRDTVNPMGAAKRALKMYREGGNNDTIDKLIKGGLQIGTPEDVAGHEVQHGLDKFADEVNKRLPLRLTGVGHAARFLASLDKKIEALTFGFLQTGFKINVASSEFERAIGRGVEPARAARLAASYANDLFGSLDYYRVATETDSHIMRKLGTAALNQNSRKVLQLILFAPDWTMATFRSIAKALPGGTTDAELMQLHRRYMVKAAIYYFTVANAVNYAMTGHSTFENDNPLRVELGDGRTMQFSKHDTEPLAWLQDPIGTALGKSAFIGKSALGLYRSHMEAGMHHKPMPTPVEDAATVGSSMAPISLQQFIQNGVSMDDLMSFLGMPIYGKTKEQKAEAKQSAKQKKIQESYAQ